MAEGHGGDDVRRSSLVQLPMGSGNSASVYQAAVSRLVSSTLITEEEEEEEIPLTGDQRGLVLTATLEWKIIYTLAGCSTTRKRL
jgi:hypothetical protein